ncbi:efflux transporter outer membrane subunit [Pseudomonas costantinii]|uniref:Efflux transporter, outer membrane factor (OMF) lipoprotein, NodT family n=1 Tax=Pseudomonas costantinii TaxID=168469 RepID=A0A1S2ULJ4_9PSED|nr:efflux transporter outer membrane subunit [Pseudomonas costantinii]NVZ18901.1 efflux transporter outer membrane subunit [Pseudomonas costantinii]OIN47302.1 multidrug transporter [Pseudomonas costantinii]SEE45974.1 efflux transporter, outer membrane factor (OMF) lipoprotein, NodT family [Pseudomonas costantinii]
MSVARSSFWLVGLLLSGCSMVPDYQTPSVPLASQWETGQPAQAPAGGAWWREFHSAELDQLIARGLATNYTLKAAVSRIDQARASAQVVGAAQYPALNLGGNFQRQNNYGTTPKRSVFGEATYELDFWGKQRAAADSADALAEATVFDANTLRMSLSASIADSYFQVLSLQERLRLAQSIADDARQVLDLVEVQASQGAVSNLEVAQQRNAMQTFEAAMPALRQQRDQALYQLAVLVGAPPEGFHVQGEGLKGLQVPQPATGLPIGLLRQRPDIQAAEARLVSANFDVGVARAAFLPNLSVDLLGGFDTLAGGQIWSAIGTLRQPLFRGGQLKGQLHFDQAHVQELTASYRESIIEALQDVETQLSAARELDKSYTLNQAAVDSAREAARLAQVRYRLGSTDFQTLLIVERTQYQAEDSVLQVRLQHLQAAVGLFRALGGDFSTAAIASQSPVQVAQP